VYSHFMTLGSVSF